MFLILEGITNVYGFFDTVLYLKKGDYSISKAQELYRQDCAVTGFPWDQINVVLFGVGDSLAYSIYGKKD